MLVPRPRTLGLPLELPRGTGSALLALAGVLLAAVAATIVSSARIAPELHESPGGRLGLDARSAAYIVPVREGAFVEDVVYVYDGDSAGPVAIARFPAERTTHARGSESPRGDTLAVVRLADLTHTQATLTLIDVPSGARRDADVRVDLHAHMAWAQFPTGARLAVTSSRPIADSPFSDVTIFEVEAPTGRSFARLTVDRVREAAPVGYSADRRSLYYVTVGQSGSILWKEAGGERVQLAVLSPGRTTGWRLDPTGSQLAYVDILGAGERTAAGRTLNIATGVIVTTEVSADPEAAAWRPGSGSPDFGGQGGGTLSIEGDTGVRLSPVAWSADGSRLVAVTYREGLPGPWLELLSTQRVLLSTEPDATLLGFVVTPRSGGQ